MRKSEDRLSKVRAERLSSGILDELIDPERIRAASGDTFRDETTNQTSARNAEKREASRRERYIGERYFAE